MAATDAWRRIARRVAGLFGGLLASNAGHAATLPEDKAEAMYHIYEGGGLKAEGPALLVRKSLGDRISVSGSYYVDAVTNASIDVVTTASPFKETRKAYDLGLDYLVRDSVVSVSAYNSSEPDYDASSVSLGVSQEMFGGMTTVTLGYTRASDKVLKKGAPEFSDRARHWQYRVGVTQILTPRWLASLNFEAISDDGFLGSPYRSAREFGAPVPERLPRTRTSRAVKLRAVGDIGARQAVRGEYRYFWDTWDIKAHTVEAGYSRYFGDEWLVDGFARWHSQDRALFYSDNATTSTRYLSRSRQLGTFSDFGMGLKATWTARTVPGQYVLKLHGAYEFVRYKFKDFTDVRTGQPYAYDASILQLFVSATF